MNYIQFTIILFFWIEGLKGYDNKAGYRLCNRYREHEMIKTVINKYCAALSMIYRILIAIIPETKILRCFAFDWLHNLMDKICVFIIWIWKINSNNVKKISIFWTYETFCYSIYFTRYMFKYLDMYIHVICHLMPQCKSSLLGWNIHICHLLFSAHWCYQHIEKNMKLTMKFFLHFNGVQ